MASKTASRVQFECHYFFDVKDKVVQMTASLCTRGGEFEVKANQAYEDEVTEPLKDFYNYIQS